MTNLQTCTLQVLNVHDHIEMWLETILSINSFDFISPLGILNFNLKICFI